MILQAVAVLSPSASPSSSLLSLSSKLPKRSADYLALQMFLYQVSDIQV